MRRWIEVPVAVALGAVASPALIAAALWVKAVSKGPVFFRQERVGKDGQRFLIWKLRTMDVEAGATDASMVTVKDDPRLIRGGQIIRKFKLDELPQLANVVVGTMALVGPRPTVFEDYQKMNARQRRRFSVRPGITGLAQVSGNTALPWPARIELDLEYVDKQGELNDLALIAKTTLLVVTGRSETHPESEDEWAG